MGPLTELQLRDVLVVYISVDHGEQRVTDGSLAALVTRDVDYSECICSTRGGAAAVQIHARICAGIYQQVADHSRCRTFRNTPAVDCHHDNLRPVSAHSDPGARMYLDGIVASAVTLQCVPILN